MSAFHFLIEPQCTGIRTASGSSRRWPRPALKVAELPSHKGSASLFSRIRRQPDGKRCLGHLSVPDGLLLAHGRSTPRWGTGFALRTRLHSPPPSISSAARGRNPTGQCRWMKSEIGATCCRSCPAVSTNGCRALRQKAWSVRTPSSLASALHSKFSAAIAGSRSPTGPLSRSVNTWSRSGPPSRTRPSR